MPKLTPRQKAAALLKRKAILLYVGLGQTQASVARRMRCSQQYVSKVVRAAKEQTTCN